MWYVFHLIPKHPRIITPSAPLPNQINKIRETKLQILFFLFTTNIYKKIEFYFGGPDLQHRMPEKEDPSCEIEKDNFRVSQGTQLRTNNKGSFESKVLKQATLRCSCRCRRGFVNSLISRLITMSLLFPCAL